MLAAFIKALKQLREPELKGVVLAGVLGALALEILLTVSVWQVLALFKAFQWDWLDALIDALGVVLALVFGLAYYSVLAIAIVGFFLDRVAGAVEAKHFPHLPPPRQTGIMEGVVTAGRFLLVSAGLNLLALPLYFIPGVNLALYLLLNGYLVGREYFELVAARRVSPKDAANLRVANRGPLLLVGVAGAALMALPFINLAAPVLLAAWMTHVLQTLLGREKAL